MSRGGDSKIALAILSAFCTIVIIGLYLYTGSPIPDTSQSTVLGVIIKWIIWCGLVFIPLYTIYVFGFHRRDR